MTGVPNFGTLNLVKNWHFSSSKSNISTSTLWNWLKFSEYLDYLNVSKNINWGIFGAIVYELRMLSNVISLPK